MAAGGKITIDTCALNDEIFDFPCTMCFRKHKNSEAEHYCVQCGDYYCKICVKIHEEVPVLAGHIIQGKAQFPPDSPASPQFYGRASVDVPTERCEIHTHQLIDMYCQDHDCVGCGTCIAVDHKKCKNTFYIPEYLRNKKKISTKEMRKKTDECIAFVKEHIKKLDLGKQDVLNKRGCILHSIIQYRKEINKRLDELERNTIDDVSTQFNGIIATLEEDIKKYDALKTSLESVKRRLKSDDKNKSQRFVTVNRAKQRTRQVRDIKDVPVVDDNICLDRDQALDTLLHRMRALGTLVQKQHDLRPTKKPSLLPVGRSKEFCIKEGSDTSDCDISSACTLSDGTVMLSDTENKKLKRLECTTFTVIDHCDLPEQPMQVCVTNINEVAVSLPFQRQIQFASFGDSMNLTHKIETDFECCGLAFADDKLFISDRSIFVYIFNLSGRKLAQYNIDQPGDQLYRYINSISVSFDGSGIYIADGYNELVILNKDGNTTGKFSDMLNEPYGSCLTNDGSLLLCGCSSNNVLQFGLDGELIGEIIKSEDSKSTYQAICCIQPMGKILIGSSSNFIAVYDVDTL